MEAKKPYDIERLTDVAIGVFAERGYDGASMDDVARAAGITKAGIYHHVAGKEALLERGLKRALDALDAVFADSDVSRGPRAELRRIVLAVAELTFALRPQLSVLFRIRGNSSVEREAIERRRTFDRRLTALVVRAQAAGEIRPDLDPGLVVRLIFGMSNSIVEWYRADGRISNGEIAHAVAAIAFEGLTARR